MRSSQIKSHNQMYPSAINNKYVETKEYNDLQLDFSELSVVVDGKLDSADLSNDFTDADKDKLDGIEDGANLYVHPDTHPATLIVEDITHRFITDVSKDYWDDKEDALGFTAENVANKENSVLDASTSKYPTNNLVKTYVDNAVANVLNYRGAYDASGDAYPTTGGSGTAGAIMKGDMWVISGNGELDGNAVYIGDSIIAKVTTPGQTPANWDILSSNVDYVPEDEANKVTSISGASTDVQYPSAKLLYDQLQLIKFPSITTVTDTYVVLSTDETVVCNKSTDFTITLPTTVVGQIFRIKNINTGVVTVEGHVAETIDDELTQTLFQWDCLLIQCYASNKWAII